MAQPIRSEEIPGAPSTPEIRHHYPDFVQQLLERRVELIGLATEARANLDEQVMTAPGDAADESVIDTSADYFLNRANSHENELIQIRNALERIDRGVYGMCANCENPIAIERLKNLPYARLCIECQTSLERTTLRAVPKL
jgi:DnaK suppressor protein